MIKDPKIGWIPTRFEVRVRKVLDFLNIKSYGNYPIGSNISVNLILFLQIKYKGKYLQFQFEI